MSNLEGEKKYNTIEDSTVVKVLRLINFRNIFGGPHHVNSQKMPSESDETFESQTLCVVTVCYILLRVK